MNATPALVAEVGEPGGVIPAPPPGHAAHAATASVSLLLLLFVAAWVCAKTKGAQWPHIGLGVLIGVVGAGTLVGAVAWDVVDVLQKVVNAVGEAM